MKYPVEVRAIYLETYEVEAESPEQARFLVDDAGAELVFTEPLESLGSPVDWAVSEMPED